MTGKAYLVGAGPGRADLITVRGLRLLREAEVVIYDRLIAAELLKEIPDHAERIFVGKAPNQHTMSQEAINRVLVEKVQGGKQVVRLKGGDPFVFGRGGEEALALSEAGLPFEIVPGISSSVATPAFAGIPVTHRGISTAFVVVTGHEQPGKTKTTTEWSAIAKIPTIVIMMGVGHIEAICTSLLNAGRAKDTPAAAVEQGTTGQQQTVQATLETLPQVISEQDITPPAVIVIGGVSSLSQKLDWFNPDEHTDTLVDFSEFNKDTK